jgi:hypothetical protein
MKLNWVYNIPHPALDTHEWTPDNYTYEWHDYQCAKCGLRALNDGEYLFFLAPGTKNEELYYTCDELIIMKVLL